MLATPTTTTIQYGSPADDVFKHEMTSSQSPSDGFVGLPPPPPPPPAPPVFNINTNLNNLCKPLLPHQEVNLVVNRAQINEIPARSVPTMLMSGSNIWTRRVLPNLRIKQTVFDEHYGESKPTMTGHYRRSSLTSTYQGGGGGSGGINEDGPLSFVLLDATSKMLYDVPMRHLLQLVKKDHDDDASIDHVIRAIDETHMKSEWLDAVTALNKQFDKRPEDKARVLAHKGSTHGLVLIEQFFVKLVRVPAYEFKLIYLKFREEAPAQLERMSKHINDLLESVQVILNNEQLPGILQVLCLLYNSVTGKTIPGLHFDSLLSVLSTRTPKQNTTIAHVLCHLLEEQYPELLNIFDDQILVKLKDLSAIKYVPIYVDIRLLYTRYKQLNSSLRDLQEPMILLPDHIKNTLADLQNVFTKLFDDENKIKKSEKDLAAYFCVWDLSLEVCLSTLGQFIDKLRLAHMQNVEQRRRHELLLKQQQRTYDHRILSTPTTARLLRNGQSQYGSDTNIFRDHLNVPLTPTTVRQRSKVNKIVRERFSASSRDVSYIGDDQNQLQSMTQQQQQQQEQMETSSTPGTAEPSNVMTSTPVSTTTAGGSGTTRIQNLLPNAVPRKRGHSPAAKAVLTKRPFNALPVCPPHQSVGSDPDVRSDDVFLNSASSDESSLDQDPETKMDCSDAAAASESMNGVETHSNDDHLLPSADCSSSSTLALPTARVISVCEIQPSFYLTAPIRRLYDSSTEASPTNDQSTPYSTISSAEHEHNCLTSALTDYHPRPHSEYSDLDDENNKENHQHRPTLTSMATSSSDLPANTESCSAVPTPDDDSQPSSSLSLPVHPSSDDHPDTALLPTSVLSDSETFDEGFETQSNVSETVEANLRSSPIEPLVSNQVHSTLSSSLNDETLADELTRRLNFTPTRRSSHDSSTSHFNQKKSPLSHNRPISHLKTSTSAYSYPTFTSSTGQSNLFDQNGAKRTPSAESLRTHSNNNNVPFPVRSSRHIQRCAVSRRISTEKESDDTSKSLTSSSSSSAVPISTEPDELSSSSTVTTATTTTNNTVTPSSVNAPHRRIPTTKPKKNLRHSNALTTSTSRSNSPLTNHPKIFSRLGHASSCQNVSTLKALPMSKSRSPGNFFLNSSQILRSSFTRPSEKPLRALPMSNHVNNPESLSNPRPSPRTRRLFGTNFDSEAPSAKSSRKPPSSWHHSKTTNPKTPILPNSNNLIAHRKTSTSALDLRKTTPIHTSVFQRVNQSKRV